MIKRLNFRLRQATNLNDPKAANCIDRCAGWSDGGCFGLALALMEWSLFRAQPMGIFRKGEDVMQHGLVAIRSYVDGMVLLDGDGASTQDQLLDRWANEELGGPCLLRPVSIEALRRAHESDPVVRVDQLLIQLNRQLGSVHTWGIGPFEGPEERRSFSAPETRSV